MWLVLQLHRGVIEVILRTQVVCYWDCLHFFHTGESSPVEVASISAAEACMLHFALENWCS